MDRDITERLRMDHTDVEGKVLFTSYAWRAFLGIRGSLVREVISEFYSTLRSREGVLDLDAEVPSYTQIREPLRRLCHRLIAFTIARR
ncbi:hypothetical protein Tco_1443144, partial [Tanacetum coccineum]